jgi:hypothetical protein
MYIESSRQGTLAGLAKKEKKTYSSQEYVSVDRKAWKLSDNHPRSEIMSSATCTGELPYCGLEILHRDVAEIFLFGDTSSSAS